MVTDPDKIVIAKPSKRILALLLDLIINILVAVVLFLPSVFALINVFVNNTQANIIALFVASAISGALTVCFSIFYFVCVPVFWDGQSVGKRFFGIRIIDTSTNEGPNAKVMFIREATRIILAVFTLGLSSIVSLITLCVTDKHITFHEEISSTRVINMVEKQDNAVKDTDY